MNAANATLKRDLTQWVDRKLGEYSPLFELEGEINWRTIGEEEILELGASSYLGNEARMVFSFPQDSLMREFTYGLPFRLPYERFMAAPSEAFSLEDLHGEVQYLTGVMYDRRNLEIMEEMPHKFHKLGFLVQEADQASYALVKLTSSEIVLDLLIRENEESLFGLLERGDVLLQHWVDGEIYLVLDLEESRRIGMLHDELLN